MTNRDYVFDKKNFFFFTRLFFHYFSVTFSNADQFSFIGGDMSDHSLFVQKSPSHLSRVQALAVLAGISLEVFEKTSA